MVVDREHLPSGAVLPRYSRPREDNAPLGSAFPQDVVPLAATGEVIDRSSLSSGSKQLLRGLLRLGTTRLFPGGGAGIEYGSLLKTAVRPDDLSGHVAEAAAHLRAHGADLLLVPGMSGYPIGAMYSLASGLPAVLLKKGALDATGVASYPPGSFVIPSYTGEGDVVMSADPAAVQDIVDAILSAQLRDQEDEPAPRLTLRAAGADDIIDKATMSQAVGDSALVLGNAAITDFLRRHRLATGDRRPFSTGVNVVAWVTPLIKGYNQPREHLRQAFGIDPFAGIEVTSVWLDPPALGIVGVGVVALPPPPAAARGRVAPAR